MFGFVLIFNQFVPFRFFLFIFVDSDVVLSNEYGSQVRNSLFRIVRGGWVIYVKLVRSSVRSFVR